MRGDSLCGLQEAVSARLSTGKERRRTWKPRTLCEAESREEGLNNELEERDTRSLSSRALNSSPPDFTPTSKAEGGVRGHPSSLLRSSVRSPGGPDVSSYCLSWLPARLEML